MAAMAEEQTPSVIALTVSEGSNSTIDMIGADRPFAGRDLN